MEVRTTPALGGPDVRSAGGGDIHSSVVVGPPGDRVRTAAKQGGNGGGIAGPLEALFTDDGHALGSQLGLELPLFPGDLVVHGLGRRLELGLHGLQLVLLAADLTDEGVYLRLLALQPGFGVRLLLPGSSWAVRASSSSAFSCSIWAWVASSSSMMALS